MLGRRRVSAAMTGLSRAVALLAGFSKLFNFFGQARFVSGSLIFMHYAFGGHFVYYRQCSV